MLCSMGSLYQLAYELKKQLSFVINSFSAKVNIEVFENNTDSGESARNELSHLKTW